MFVSSALLWGRQVSEVNNDCWHLAPPATKMENQRPGGLWILEADYSSVAYMTPWSDLKVCFFWVNPEKDRHCHRRRLLRVPSMHRSRRDGPPSVPGRWGLWLGPWEGRCVSHRAGAQDSPPMSISLFTYLWFTQDEMSLCSDLSAAGVLQGVSHQTVNEDWCL